MNNELVSVIVPVYNVEKYLKRCVESILKQTYKNIECILVDDGSTDQCPVLCDEFNKSDSRVQVIHRKNGGLSSARNAGIDVAKGEYLLFVDSDDYIACEMIEVLHNKLIDTESDIAMCDLQYVYEDARKEKEHKSPVIDEVIGKKELLEKLLKEYSGVYVVICNKLYKKELWNHLRFPLNVIHEDEAVIHDLFLQCSRFVSIKEKMYFYYQRPDSIMNSEKSDKNLIYYEFLADRFIKIEGLVEDKYLKRRIELNWWEYMDTYYKFWKRNPKSIYLKKMKKSLWKVMPLMKKYNLCSLKEYISILIFLINSKVYNKLFYTT